MARGRVETWNGEVGFLRDAADNARVFFGDRALRGGLRPEAIQVGQELEFDRELAERGPRARNVRPVGAGSPAPAGPPTGGGAPPREGGGRGGPRPGPPPGRADHPPRGRAGPPPSPAPRDGFAVPPREVPVPAALRGILANVPVRDRHPGLQLDKFLVPCPQQEQQRDRLSEVAHIPGNDALLREVSAVRAEGLEALGAVRWERTTETTLTLHLARTAALENAGLCLHPVYGFAFLPGTGLKGMARAYAETVWLPAQPDQGTARRQIEDVFGWAPDRDRQGREVAGCAGAVVFHDAWPASWPRLLVDIVNNHHPSYYQEGQPPGDWDSPVPVYFLAVAPGATFSFALARRRADVPASLLELARAWLDSGLSELGCGAKTVAGYGYFAPAGAEEQAPPSPFLLKRRATLTLATPGFLAGARQQRDDCDLRSATLRGLLRWWWRTLHAGYLDARELAALEAALWGDTKAGGAIRLRLRPSEAHRPAVFAYKDRFDPQANFKRQHNLADRPDNKTTQGVFYVSYGMDEAGRPGGEGRRQRLYLDAGSSWRLVLAARPTRFLPTREPGKEEQGMPLSAEQVLRQAEAALWLLCHFGAAGSKARKGFGSLQAQFEPPWEELDLAGCSAVARELRRALGLEREVEAPRLTSPALDDPDVRVVEVDTPWTDPWQALDQVGFVYQAFAQRYAHRPEKAALGLPRKIHGPNREPMRFQDADRHQPPEWLSSPRRAPRVSPENARFASPVHIHLDAGEGGRLRVRFIAFPSAELPDRATSVRVLHEFLDHCRAELTARSAAPAASAAPRPAARAPAGVGGGRPGPGGGPGRGAPAGRGGGGRAAPAPPPARLRTRDRVEVEVVEDPKGKGRLFVRHEGSNLVGPVLNAAEVPAESKAVGQRITVEIHALSADGRQVSFRWPAPPAAKK